MCPECHQVKWHLGHLEVTIETYKEISNRKKIERSFNVSILTIVNHIAIVNTTYLGSNSSTIRLSDSPYEKRKSGGTENGMFGQEALFLL